VRELAIGPSGYQNDSRPNGATKVTEGVVVNDGDRIRMKENAIDARLQQLKEKHIVVLNNVPLSGLTMDLDQSDKATADSDVAFMDVD
jgi:hypothetical protein